MAIQMWPMTLTIGLYSLLVSYLDARYELEKLHLPIGFAALPGSFVGVILAFRTTSSYRRWWEARILWGCIVNDSRSWVRELISFSGDALHSPSDRVRRMAYRQIAWCYTLTRSLRHESPVTDIGELVESRELSEIQRHNNVPNALLLQQGVDLSGMRNEGTIDTWQFVALEKTLVRLTDSMGGCERIRNTPFPPQYRTWVHFLIYLFILILPFSFVDTPWLVMIFVTVPVATAYLIVERVALELENPFTEIVSGTPMTTISRTIDINLRQMIGESDVPPEMQPEDDVLY